MVGLVHRLDVPTSGLSLTAQTIGSAYFSKQHLHTHDLLRDYVVHCFERTPVDLCEIHAPLFHSACKGIRAAGQPSQTYLSILSHPGKATTGIAPVHDTENGKPVCELLGKMREDLITGSCVDSLICVANLLQVWSLR